MKDTFGFEIQPKDLVAWTQHKGGNINIGIAVVVKDTSIQLACTSYVSKFTNGKRDSMQVLKLSTYQIAAYFKQNPGHKNYYDQQLKNFKLD